MKKILFSLLTKQKHTDSTFKKVHGGKRDQGKKMFKKAPGSGGSEGAIIIIKKKIKLDNIYKSIYNHPWHIYKHLLCMN